MRTYDRNGVHIEQCESCRGIFLDLGELENLNALESRFAQQPPPAPGYGQGHGGHGGHGGQQYGPGWGSHGGHRYRKKGFGGLFFSS
jgi:Zn-finger nucleic acid-binding protein